MKTLPELCREWDESLDVVRLLLRKRPDLAKLATQFGVTRVFDAAAAKKLRDALTAKRKKKLAVA